MSRVFDLITSSEWAITDHYLQGMIEISLREDVSVEALRDRWEALQAKSGKPLENTRKCTVRDGVAVIPVVGPIFPRANLFTNYSGGTSAEVLAQDIRTATENDDVSSIILEIDSPGGQVTGIAEVAALIAGNPKPIHGYGMGSVASGAYWIGAACHTLTIAPTAVLGSIGVLSTVSKPDKNPNSKTVDIVSSQSPDKRIDVTTDAGRAKAQATADAMADVFVEAVASYRGVDAKTVLADFGKGGVLIGYHAVAAGMADGIGTFESLISGICSGRVPKGRSSQSKSMKGMTMSKETTDKPPVAEGQGMENAVSLADFQALQKRLEKAEATANAEAEKNARFAAQVEAEKRINIGVNATVAASEALKAGHITKPGQGLLATLHALAALDDAGITGYAPKVDEKGTVSLVATGSADAPKVDRSSLLSGFVAGLPKHGMFAESLPGGHNLKFVSNDETSDMQAKEEQENKEIRERVKRRSGQA